MTPSCASTDSDCSGMSTLSSISSNLTHTSYVIGMMDPVPTAYAKVVWLARQPERLHLTKRSKTNYIDPAEVLKGMLQFAPSDKGRLYMANAILNTCTGTPDEVTDLVKLSNTYVIYFLWPCEFTTSPVPHFPPFNICSSQSSFKDCHRPSHLIFGHPHIQRHQHIYVDQAL